MRDVFTRILLIAAMLSAMYPQVVPAQDDDVRERGRTLTHWLLEGEVDMLFEAMSPDFRRAIGGREGLQQFAALVEAQAGAERELRREEVFRADGYTTYYRISRYERIPNVTAQWTWNAEGTVVGGSITPTPEPAASEYLDYDPKTKLQLPFGIPVRGTWYVWWGGRDPVLNYHVVAPDQRFAYDFVVLRDGRTHAGDGRQNEDYYCFGEPVYAPAAGRVVTVVDSIADNARPSVTNPDAPAGNYVVIAHGNGEHSLVAHLRRDSLVVDEGEAVGQGDLLGECGNSGNSSMPHVHYHLQTGTAFGEGVGLPAPFNGYFMGGRYVPQGEPVRGQIVTPSRTGND